MDEVELRKVEEEEGKSQFLTQIFQRLYLQRDNSVMTDFFANQRSFELSWQKFGVPMGKQICQVNQQIDSGYLLKQYFGIKSMDSDTKKYIAIGTSVAVGIFALIFLKNKLEEATFQPLPRDQVIAILKKAKKENFAVLKQISAMASQIAMQMQMKQVDPSMVKAYMESPESPINANQSFEDNFKKVCQEHNVNCNCEGIQDGNFNNSVEHYLKNEDREIKYLVEEQERDYETSLSGRMPQPKVTVPEFLTKDRLLEIQKKLALKKYLIQVDMYRRLRGKSQQELMGSPDLMKSLPNPQQQEEKILQEEGVGSSEEPPTAVFAAAVMKYKNDANFKETLGKIDNDFKKIFNKYVSKMQSNKITEEELNELEDELIYSQHQGF